MPAASDPGRAYAPFRPRRAPVVCAVVAVVVAVTSVLLAVVVPGPVQWWDRAGFVLAGAAVVWFLYRQATVRAVPSPSGLEVRNLVYTRTVSWPEVLEVSFGGGRPWVQLDLADGDTLAVMGVQRADGQHAVTEAGRLAALAAAHGPTSRGPTDRGPTDRQP